MFSWKNNKSITVGGFIQCNMVRWYHAWIMNTQSSIIFLKHIFCQTKCVSDCSLKAWTVGSFVFVIRLLLNRITFSLCAQFLCSVLFFFACFATSFLSSFTFFHSLVFKLSATPPSHHLFLKCSLSLQIYVHVYTPPSYILSFSSHNLLF